MNVHRLLCSESETEGSSIEDEDIVSPITKVIGKKGQSVSLAHLAPFVDISRQNIKKKLKDELKDLKLDDESIDKIVESRLKEEIRSGVQTIQYQINTLNTSNG